MMPQTGPALRGAFCFAPFQLAASSIFRSLLRHGLGDLRDQLFDDDVPNELEFSATMTNAPGPPMTLLR
jgi:hypothetical protein